MSTQMERARGVARQARAVEAERVLEEARESLRVVCPRGRKVYTQVRHVSRSGAYRRISAYVILDNTPVCLDLEIAKVLGDAVRPPAGDGGVGVSGVGMNMSFWLVYQLALALHQDGYALKVDYM